MALITWGEGLLVGIPEIDSEHEKIVHMINELHAAMKEGKGKSLMANILAAVEDYTKSHLTHEEELMIRYGYPEYLEHKAIHVEFIGKIEEYKNLNEQQVLQARHLINVLQSWLLDHIANTDKRYSSFLREAIAKN